MSVDRARRRRHRRRWRRWCVGGFLAVAAMMMTMMTRMTTVAAVLPEKKLTVVNIRMTTDKLIEKACPIKCSGTLLKPTMVLTAASCAVPKDVDDEATNSATVSTTTATTITTATNESDEWFLTPETTPETSLAPDKTLLKKGVYINVYKNQPTTSESQHREVTNLYLHPLWNRTTLVANLALLKIESPFDGHGYESETLIMPLLLEDLNTMPTELKFKGFGMIATDDGLKFKLNDDSRLEDLNDRNMLRLVKVQNYNNTCKGMEEEFERRWSFLCTESTDVRTNIQNTLCSSDVGGPLYSVAKSTEKVQPTPTLYGVFSHVYHTTQPFCATLECSIMSKAPIPCRWTKETSTQTQKGEMFYKHTALLGRYSRWVLMTIELAVLIPTEGPTFDCPTVQTMPTTQSTTIDRDYDYDVYSDQRFMVANQKVCPKKGGLSSSTHVLQPLPTGIVLAAAIVGLVLAA